MSARGTAREVARDYVYVIVARGVTLAISFARSLIIPGLLGPLSYGIWKTLGLIQTYAQFGDLGTRAALRREVPYALGRGDQDRLAEVQGVSFLVNNLSILGAAVCTVIAAILVEEGPVRQAMLFFLPLLYIAHVNSFMEQLLSGHKEFAWMSRLSIWTGLLEAALAIGLTWAFGLAGLILGTALAYAVATWLQVRHLAFDLRFRWDRRVFAQLVSVGFPSHLNGLLYNIFLSTDRWLILTFLGMTSMGYYALGMTINEYLFQFSYTFGNVLSPRLVERYSERESLEDLRHLVETPLLIISRVAPAGLGVVYFASEAVLNTALTSFLPGLPSLQILLVGTFFSSVPRGLSSFFITIRRQSQTVHLYIIAILLNFVLVFGMLKAGWGLPGAAAGTAISLAFFGTGLVVLALRYFMPARAALVFLGRLVWPLLLGLLLVAAARLVAAWATGGHPLGTPILASALFLAGYSPVLLLVYRRWGAELRGTRSQA